MPVLLATSIFVSKNWILKIDQSWEDYLASREDRVRNTLKRKSKKFSQSGGSLEVVSSKQEIHSALEDFQTVYRSSWKIPRNRSECFIPWACPNFRRSRLDQSRHRAHRKGQAVAAQIWITKGERASIFKLAYDERFRDYSPGTLLTAKLMEHAFKIDKVLEIDYMRETIITSESG